MMSRFISPSHVYSFFRLLRFAGAVFSFLLFWQITVLCQAAQVTIKWNYDGTLTEPGGFKIYLGESEIPVCGTFDTAARALTCDVELAEGVNNFTITAFDSTNESAHSTVFPFFYAATDTDKDGISDTNEATVYGTNPGVADTDGDGINDGDEAAYWGTNWNGDEDGDGILNLLDPDSDNDGILDGIEIARGTNPGISGNVIVTFSWEYSASLTAPAGFRAYLDGVPVPGCETHDPDARQMTCEVNLEPGPGVFTITAFEGTNESVFSTALPFDFQGTGSNSAPVANNLELQTEEDKTVNLFLIASDPDGDSLTYSIVSNGSRGQASITDSNSGAFKYTPDINATGTDSFTFKANDGKADSNIATVVVSISPVNDLPVAVSDSAVTNEDSPVTIAVLSNDSDPDGDAINLVSAGTGALGVTQVSGNNVIYTPSLNLSGTDSFTYQISDGHGGFASGSVSVTINKVNDLPSAAADTASTSQNTAVTIAVLSNDSDPDNDALTLVSVDQGSHGSTKVSGNSVVYTPTQNFAGVDSFTYKISDGQGGFATGSITVTTMEPPSQNLARVTLTWNYNRALTAPAGFRVYLDGQPVPGCETNDPDAREITCDIELAEGRRVLAITAFEGANESVFSTWFPFEYKMTPLAKEAPEAVSDHLEAKEDSTANGILRASDLDSVNLTYSIVTNGSKGQATIIDTYTGAYVYNPYPNATGLDSFTFKANDGELDSNEATITVNISPLNDAPAASITTSTPGGPPPLVVSFDATASSDIDGTIEVYAWNFGDGETGTGAQIEHAFQLAGTYTIDLMIADDLGATAKTSTTIIVAGAPQENQAPSVDITPTLTSGKAPLSVTFYGTATDPDGSITGYSWNFGDGSSLANGSEVNHTFMTSGTFNVVLTVTDNRGATAQKTVTVQALPSSEPNLLPSAKISASVLKGPAPLSVWFNGSESNDSDGHITAYSWDFGDGDTASDSSTQHTFTAPGSYTVKLTVTDNLGGDSVATVNISVSTEGEQTYLPIETGEVQISDGWTSVQFTRTFANPVVVATPSSSFDPEPCVVRLRNVTESGFEIRIQEWDYLDGVHQKETVGYVVMEAGSYELPDGTLVEAGRFTTQNIRNFKPFNFVLPFNVTPVVVTSIASFNGENAVTGRLRNITTAGFEYKTQKEESERTAHVPETVCYIAWEPSIGQIGGTIYEVNRNILVDEKWQPLVFEETFQTAPVPLADSQTMNGGNPFSIRYRAKDTTQMELKVAEEQSKDSEVNHVYEDIGYMLFSVPE